MRYQDAFVRRWYQRVWNENNIDAIDEMMHPDCLAHGLGEQPVKGIQAFRDSFMLFKTMLPTLMVEVTDVHIDGDIQIAQCDVKATSVNGKEVHFYGTSIARVVDDKIVEGWNYFDFLNMYTQLGMMNVIVPEIA